VKRMLRHELEQSGSSNYQKARKENKKSTVSEGGSRRKREADTTTQVWKKTENGNNQDQARPNKRQSKKSVNLGSKHG